MLVLSRELGEFLMIGDQVAIKVIGIKGNQVRFGISAPKNIPVHREEIYARIQREKLENKSVAQEETVDPGSWSCPKGV